MVCGAIDEAVQVLPVSSKVNQPLYKRAGLCGAACGLSEAMSGKMNHAGEAERLRAADNTPATRLAGMNIADALRSSDPQAQALARFTGLQPETIRDALAVLVALLVELGSGFGLFAVSGHAAGAAQPEAPAAGTSAGANQGEGRHAPIWATW